MADALKVFKNQNNTTLSSSIAAIPIDVVTTNSTSQAVVKDIVFSVQHTDPLYDGIYTCPLKVKLDGFTIAEQATGASVTLTGSQIVDASSSLTIEIQAESQKTYFGAGAVMLNVDNKFQLFQYPVSKVGDPTGKGVALLDAIKGTGTPVSSGNVYGRSGCTIMRNGEMLFCYVPNSGDVITVINAAGTTVATITMPAQTYAICADGTYIYGRANSSDAYIHRYSISTLTYTDTLATAGLPGYPANNNGFFDYYNGYCYLRGPGSDPTLYRIDVSNGTTTTYATPAQSENIGGLITVNTSGVPYLVEYQDTQYIVMNLNTMTYSTYSGVFGTDPTTTGGNQVAVLANGIVLFHNGSYSQVVLIDVNGSTPVGTQVTSSIALTGGPNGLMISKPFQITPPQVARSLKYSLLASGVSVTN